MRVFIALATLGSMNLEAQVPVLPKGYAPWELDLIQTYIPLRLANGSTTPPELPVRAAAEWEEVDALVVTWTGYTSTVQEIVRHASEEALVYIICSDSNSVKSTLVANSISLENIQLLQSSYNSVWIRDYGQWNVYSNQVDSLLLIDWIYNRPRPDDDAVPGLISNVTGLPIYTTTEIPYDLVHTGGNFMTDGWGTGFSSKLVLDENDGNDYSLEPKSEEQIDAIMDDFMGIDRYIKMETLPYDEIHHIDMHMKLLDEETILVGEYPEGVADGPQIEENINYILDNYTSVFGTPYKIVRIPMPPDASGNYPDDGSWWAPGDYRTYTNFVFVNKTILLPVYEEQYDTTAIRILQEQLPGYNIVGIDCNDIIQALGAIHCITKEVASSEPLLITHQALPDTEEFFADYQVDAWIMHRDDIASATLYYTTDTIAGWNMTSMSLSDIGTDTWTGFIPAQEPGTEVFYYIHAAATTGKEQVRPITAPEGFWHFRVGAEMTAINEAETLGIDIYPNPFSTQVSIDLRGFNSNEKLHVQLRDMAGRKLQDLTLSAGIVHQLYTGNLPSGTYLITLQSGTTLLSRELVKL